MAFTINQERAISLRDRNILVSAAAGSGKTSVLVERIIRRITDVNNPVSIDRLLIMTFTNAAAKEMKDRIREAIENKLSENPDDDNLIRQSVLVHNARITTIHGFCQGVIRDHFEEISIDPNFRIADENECKLIRMDVMNSVLEQFYLEADDDFLKAVETLSTAKNDSKFEDLIFELYDFITSNPEPEKFLNSFLEPYNVDTLKTFTEMHFIHKYMMLYTQEIRGYIRTAELILELIEDNPGLVKYQEAIENDIDIMSELLAYDNYDKLKVALSNITFDKLKPISDKSLSEEESEVKTRIGGLRTNYKDGITKDIRGAFSFDLETVYEDMCMCADTVRVIIKVVLAFKDAFDTAKRDKNIIDFADMEHMAISILSENPEIAASFRDMFDEIYVDEYQDSNMTQEHLLDLIRRKGKASNLFMVGDVKQSIYRFRQARPDLFISKYNSYSDDDSIEQRILLNDNFRSRKEVLDSVNEIFKVIMTKDNTGIEYDKSAELRFGASYYEDNNTSYKTEMLVGIKDELSGTELEAQIVANRIRKLFEDNTLVYDKSLGGTRPIEYRDIAILCRSPKGWETALKDACQKADIPLAFASREGFFSAKEIEVALAFLSCIDNYYQDIPLATIMLSPIGGFTNKEMAIIKLIAPKDCLYEAINKAIETDDSEIDASTMHKCEALIRKLSYYKEKSKYIPVHGLLREFIDNEYGNYVRSMDRGEVRIANLNMLMTKAEDYGKTSFRGLFNFVRYIELIRKYEIEDGQAGVLGEEDDVVRVMTIHKSKGLEFPVCFVVGIEKNRNTQDEKKSVLKDPEMGIGLERVFLDRRVKRDTLYKNLIRKELAKENLAEEMRVLYVAMTRAREKLIMVGCSKDEQLISPKKTDIMSCLSYMEMIGIAQNDSGILKHTDISFIREEELVRDEVKNELIKESIGDDLLGVMRNLGDEYEVPAILHKLQFEYGHKSYDIPSKLSVSELKHMAIEEELLKGEDLAPEGFKLFADTSPDTYIPKFMRHDGVTTTGGTFYGTAFHRILELWKYEKSQVDSDDVKSFANEMLKKNQMNKEQVDAIRADDIAFFLNSNVGNRLFMAKKNGKLFREQPFVIGVTKGEIIGNDEASDDNLVLVQGIIDAFIEEDDGIMILDYKTDYVTSADMLVKRYKAQLEYYKKALEQVTSKKVKELIIYSSRLRQEIRV